MNELKMKSLLSFKPAVMYVCRVCSWPFGLQNKLTVTSMQNGLLDTIYKCKCFYCFSTNFVTILNDSVAYAFMLKKV